LTDFELQWRLVRHTPFEELHTPAEEGRIPVQVVAHSLPVLRNSVEELELDLFVRVPWVLSILLQMLPLRQSSILLLFQEQH
jgi:hypothetical protein